MRISLVPIPTISYGVLSLPDFKRGDDSVKSGAGTDVWDNIERFDNVHMRRNLRRIEMLEITLNSTVRGNEIKPMETASA